MGNMQMAKVRPTQIQKTVKTTSSMGHMQMAKVKANSNTKDSKNHFEYGTYANG